MAKHVDPVKELNRRRRGCRYVTASEITEIVLSMVWQLTAGAAEGVF
jgi:hypothetical protein